MANPGDDNYIRAPFLASAADGGTKRGDGTYTDLPTQAEVTNAFHNAYGRAPTPEEYHAFSTTHNLHQGDIEGQLYGTQEAKDYANSLKAPAATPTPTVPTTDYSKLYGTPGTQDYAKLVHDSILNEYQGLGRTPSAQEYGNQFAAWNTPNFDPGALHTAFTQSPEYTQHQNDASNAATTRIGGITGPVGSQISDIISGKGANPNDFSGDIQKWITTGAQKLQGDPTLKGTDVFSDSSINGLISNLTNKYRAPYTTQYTQKASNYDPNNLIPQGYGSGVIDSILGSQQAPVQQALKNAQARGNLSDIGFKAANDQLASDALGVKSQINSKASGILSGYRGALQDSLNTIKPQVDTLGLGGKINLDDLFGRITNSANTDLSSFEGDLRSQIGDTKFFDPSKYINLGGTAQGAINNYGANIDQILGSQTSRNAPRGLGTEGAF